ncbi:SRPBCC family protein [Nocardioides campestrisoli]|uniref:SRPBCC family protein n=1 Tax=Nocardioides campestrisoli TaxID=2736757 RepID=UPI0015E6E061|nr:SRPBCC family protein [Nocardioides campestrisoli]
MGFTVSQDFARPVGPVFDYLADPRNRPQWQSSLRRVDMLSLGEPGLGTTWYDVTWPGPRPLMEITGWEKNVRWVEHGRWRGLAVTLDLVFTPLEESLTRVRATTVTHAPGWRRAPGLVLDLAGPAAARADLRRAARRVQRLGTD